MKNFLSNSSNKFEKTRFVGKRRVLSFLIICVFILTAGFAYSQDFGSGYNQVSSVYQFWNKIATATTNGKATQYSLAATGSMVGLVQPDYPRNVVLTFSAGVTTCTITVSGTDATGRLTQEVFTGVNTETGSIAWSQVSSVVISVVTGGGGVTLDLGYGVKMGLANKIVNASSIYKTNMDSANVAISGATINAQYSTIIFATNPNGTHYYEVFYKGI